MFFCLSKASGGKCFSTAHLVVGFQEPCGLEPSWLWFSLICMLPLFLVQTHPAVKLEQREGSYGELRSADRSRALCSNVISITLTESLEGSNDDLSFLSRLPVGFFFL